MQSLTQRFADLLRLREQTLKCFANLGVQVEGWLKGEMLSFLTQDKINGNIHDFDREVLVGCGKRKTDLMVTFEHASRQHDIWIELKHYLIGIQKDTSYDSCSYFSDGVAGIKPDVDKFLTIPSANTYMLILMTANPGYENWQEGIRRFHDKFGENVHPLSDPKRYPDTFFLGLLYVTGNGDSIEL